MNEARTATWFDWPEGSTIFFWRWPPDCVKTVRVGVRLFFSKMPPKNRDLQPAFDSNKDRLKVKEKLDTVMRKGYIKMCGLSELEAMMCMFSVPKGETDMRMVHDGSRLGLNEATWAPWFALPTMDAMLQWTIVGSWLGDNDYGEQFLNFPLHPDMRRCCGVDLDGSLKVGRWVRNAMGLRSSPYNSIQGVLRAKLLTIGDLSDKKNPFHWDTVTMKGYDALKPWIAKLRKDGMSASELVQCVDDLRVVALTQDLSWACSSKSAKMLAFLGLQDAARQRRKSSRRPGAWSSAIVATDKEVVSKSFSLEHWEKTWDSVLMLAHVVRTHDAFSDSLPAATETHVPLLGTQARPRFTTNPLKGSWAIWFMCLGLTELCNHA